MSKWNGKTVGAVASAAMLAVTGAANVAPALAAQPDDAAIVAEQGTATAPEAAQAVVQGEFSYSQEIITPNATISSVFAKAAATLCKTATQECTACCASAIAVGGDVTNGFSATVAEMSEEDLTQALIMGCSCASNAAGGGAIANAEVEGVPLETILKMATA